MRSGFIALLIVTWLHGTTVAGPVATPASAPDQMAQLGRRPLLRVTPRPTRPTRSTRTREADRGRGRDPAVVCVTPTVFGLWVSLRTP